MVARCGGAGATFREGLICSLLSAGGVTAICQKAGPASIHHNEEEQRELRNRGLAAGSPELEELLLSTGEAEK